MAIASECFFLRPEEKAPTRRACLFLGQGKGGRGNLFLRETKNQPLHQSLPAVVGPLPMCKRLVAWKMCSLKKLFAFVIVVL